MLFDGRAPETEAAPDAVPVIGVQRDARWMTSMGNAIRAATSLAFAAITSKAPTSSSSSSSGFFVGVLLLDPAPPPPP